MSGILQPLLRPVLQPVLRSVFDPPLRRGSSSLEDQIRELFARGEQGAWYDPSDLATMFQDAAGTTPVTGVEQPVGLILDKSGNGNHASQVTTTARPMLSARVNLLNNTDMETLDGSGSVTLAQMDGFRSAARFSGDPRTAAFVRRSFTATAVGDYTFSFYVEMDDPGPPVFGGPQTPTADICLNAVSVVGKIPEHIIHVRDNIYRCIATVNTTTTGTKHCGPINYPENSNRSFNVSGFQLERGTVASKYQRVSTLTDYDWEGWPLYLAFDGVDDYLYTDSPYLQAETPEWSFGSAEQPSLSLPTFGALSGNVFVQVLASNRTRVTTRINTKAPSDPHWALDASQATSPHRWIVRSRNSGLYNGQELPILTEPTAWTPFVDGFTFIGRRGSFYRDKPIYSAVAVGRELSILEMSSLDKFLSNKLKVPA